MVALAALFPSFLALSASLEKRLLVLLPVLAVVVPVSKDWVDGAMDGADCVETTCKTASVTLFLRNCEPRHATNLGSLN